MPYESARLERSTTSVRAMQAHRAGQPLDQCDDSGPPLARDGHGELGLRRDDEL